MFRRTIQIIVVDDQSLLRFGICTLLKTSTESFCVEEVDNVRALRCSLHVLQPDILLVTSRALRPEIATNIVLLQSACSQMRIVLLAEARETDVYTLRSIGIAGIICHDEAATVLLAALMSVIQGECWFSPQILSSLLSGKARSPVTQLTAREQEVLALLATGKRNVELAQVLSVSVRTIEFHIHNILTKLGVRSRLEATRQFYQHQHTT
jgi:two-component system nitrate/nitrite response regulator NarP